MDYKHFQTWDDQEKEWMRDSSFRKATKEREAEYQIACMLIAKRRQKKMTQYQLARRAGTSQSAVARAESGSYTISLSFLKRLAHALNSRLSISLQ